MSTLNLGMIGNCQINALLDEKARIVWSCLPQFDSNPAFCSLLYNGGTEPEHGFYEIELLDFERAEQHYLINTAILQTTLYDQHGNAVEIIDFAPRFQHFERSYHPVMLTRIVRPVAGTPRIRVRLRPSCEYGKEAAPTTFGSNHIRYVTPDVTLRLTTNLSLSNILNETPFALQQTSHLILGPDESIVDDVATVAHEGFRSTRNYWQSWVRGLAIPFEWQDAVIRAAITLKMCTFEDTGAVIAAATTSVPEAADSGRNWDYRFCWLRDSYFVVQALNSLGATKTMSGVSALHLRCVAEPWRQPAAGLCHFRPAADLTEREVDTAATVIAAWGLCVSVTRPMSRSRTTRMALSSCQPRSTFLITGLPSARSDEQFRQLERARRESNRTVRQTGRRVCGSIVAVAQVHTYSAVVCWSRQWTGSVRWRASWASMSGRSTGKRMHRKCTCDHTSPPGTKIVGAFTEGFDNENLDASLLTLAQSGICRSG